MAARAWMAILSISAMALSLHPVPTLAGPGPTELLALNMYHEAKGEGRLGMLAVGWVTLNRTRDPSFPSSIEAVVTQRGQFVWLDDGRSDTPTDARAWRAAQKLAHQLLTDPPADPTRGARWFRAAHVAATGWTRDAEPTARIGNHVFFNRLAEH